MLCWILILIAQTLVSMECIEALTPMWFVIVPYFFLLVDWRETPNELCEIQVACISIASIAPPSAHLKFDQLADRFGSNTNPKRRSTQVRREMCDTRTRKTIAYNWFCFHFKCFAPTRSSSGQTMIIRAYVRGL